MVSSFLHRGPPPPRGFRVLVPLPGKGFDSKRAQAGRPPPPHVISLKISLPPPLPRSFFFFPGRCFLDLFFLPHLFPFQHLRASIPHASTPFSFSVGFVSPISRRIPALFFPLLLNETIFRSLLSFLCTRNGKKGPPPAALPAERRFGIFSPWT